MFLNFPCLFSIQPVACSWHRSDLLSTGNSWSAWQGFICGLLHDKKALPIGQLLKPFSILYYFQSGSATLMVLLKNMSRKQCLVNITSLNYHGWVPITVWIMKYSLFHDTPVMLSLTLHHQLFFVILFSHWWKWIVVGINHKANPLGGQRPKFLQWWYYKCQKKKTIWFNGRYINIWKAAFKLTD